MSRLVAALMAALVTALAAPATVSAFYGNGASIVSADFGRLEQGDDTSVFAAVSGNGRYVAFQTRARNFFADDDPDPPGRFRAGGVFRADLQTRSLALVADGDIRDEQNSDLLTRGAQNPSASADGRYVVFSTGQQLVPADVNPNIDVYVRDMTVPIRSPGAYELVSARTGGTQPASYAPREPSSPGLDPGAEVTRGAALSADGSRVAFRVTEPASDLPDRPGTDTPGGQVFVRDLTNDTTTLVTRATGAGEPAGGAIGPAGISGDGSSVVWTGANAAAQTRFVGGENTDPGFLYYLWRRVADGPSAPTRRITGLADPDDPACPPDAQVAFDQTSTGPCFGPLTDQEANRANIATHLPAVSADGRLVAFLTGAGPRPDSSTAPGLDLFVTDMSPGLSRKASTRELTREGTGGDAATGAPIESLALSSDGRRLALTSTRTNFVLPALKAIGSPRTTPGARELYVIDLPGRTIERATRGHAGDDIDADVSNGVTLSSDGSRVAFTSLAGNLFFGDGNQRADAFVLTEQREPPPAAGAPPPPLAPDTETVDPDVAGPTLPVRAKTRRDGSVELTVRVPAAGGVRATARGRAGRPRRSRALSTKSARARAGGRVKLVLGLVRRYRTEVRRRRRLLARASVTFVAARGGRRLRGSVRVTFKPKSPPKKRRSPSGRRALSRSENGWRKPGELLAPVW